MTDNLVETAPEVPGEQPVPDSDVVKPAPDDTVAEEEPAEANGEQDLQDQPAENALEASEPEPAAGASETAEPEDEQQAPGDEQAGKRKLNEEDAEEPESKKMNTGVGMEVRCSDQTIRHAMPVASIGSLPLCKSYRPPVWSDAGFHVVFQNSRHGRRSRRGSAVSTLL